MTDAEILIQSVMKSIMERWHQFEEQFNLNDFEGEPLYSIPELETKDISPKDVLEELCHLVNGHWYEFYLNILSPAPSFKFGQSVHSNLFNLIKTFGDYMRGTSEIIFGKNFTAVKKDESYFEDLMNEQIISEYTISEWLKKFELEPTELCELIGYFDNENMERKIITITGQNRSDLYAEAKHKIEWGSIHKFESKVGVSFEEIIIEIIYRFYYTVLELPWDRVKISYE